MVRMNLVGAIHILITIVEITVVEIVALLAIVSLEAVLHLRLRGGNDAVVVLGMLQVVFRHHAVAGTLRITGQRTVFFCNVLCGTANLNVRTGTVVGPGQRIGALAVEISAASASVVIIAPPTPLVLLSWPHRWIT